MANFAVYKSINIISMCKLISNPLFWVIVLIPLALIIWVIILLIKHNSAIKRLRSTTDANIQLSEEVHGIGFYVRILAYIGILFCLGVGIHYIGVFYPRFKDVGEHITYIQSLGVDYWGIIVGFLTLLVTLLVAWNIYSTIKAKDELKDAKEEIINFKKKSQEEIERVSETMRKLPQEKFDKIEQHLTRLETQLSDVKVETFESNNNTQISILTINGTRQYERASSKPEAEFEYIRAYKNFVDALCISIEVEKPTDEIAKYKKYIELCSEGMEEKKIKFDETTYQVCYDKLTSLLNKQDINSKVELWVKAIIARQEDISFKTFEQSVYDFTLKIVEQNIGQARKSAGGGIQRRRCSSYKATSRG